MDRDKKTNKKRIRTNKLKIMNGISKVVITNLVREIRELQKELTEKEEYQIWYDDVNLIDVLQPSKEVYDLNLKEIPKLRMKMVELENRLDSELEDMRTDNY